MLPKILYNEPLEASKRNFAQVTANSYRITALWAKPDEAANVRDLKTKLEDVETNDWFFKIKNVGKQLCSIVKVCFNECLDFS